MRSHTRQLLYRSQNIRLKNHTLSSVAIPVEQSGARLRRRYSGRTCWRSIGSEANSAATGMKNAPSAGRALGKVRNTQIRPEPTSDSEQIPQRHRCCVRSPAALLRQRLAKRQAGLTASQAQRLRFPLRRIEIHQKQKHREYKFRKMRTG